MNGRTERLENLIWKVGRVGDLCCNVIFVIPGKKFGSWGERGGGSGGSVKLKSILKWLKVSLAFSKARSFLHERSFSWERSLL